MPIRKAGWLLLVVSGAAAAQAPASTAPYRLGNEETARRLLFCSSVYGDIVAMNGNPKIKETAADKAQKSAARAAKLASGDTHALLARIAKDSFLEQIDGAKRSGGDAEHRRALREFEADCNRHLEEK